MKIATLMEGDGIGPEICESVAAVFAALDVIDEVWQLHGFDVFIEHPGLPVPPESIGPFTLKMMSNRGTKVWPGELPDILLADQFRCRYYSQTQVQREDVFKPLERVNGTGLAVVSCGTSPRSGGSSPLLQSAG